MPRPFGTAVIPPLPPSWPPTLERCISTLALAGMIWRYAIEIDITSYCSTPELPKTLFLSKHEAYYAACSKQLWWRRVSFPAAATPKGRSKPSLGRLVRTQSAAGHIRSGRVSYVVTLPFQHIVTGKGGGEEKGRRQK